MSTTKRQIIIDDDLWKAVKVRAATDGTSATNIVTTAVSSWLGADFSNATTTQGSEVRFAANTPPAEDRTDLTPKFEHGGPETIVAVTIEGEHFNTRPFTPVPKTARKK